VVGVGLEGEEKKRKMERESFVRKKSEDLFLCYSRYSEKEKGQHIKCYIEIIS
jgi:hypothetical protein